MRVIVLKEENSLLAVFPDIIEGRDKLLCLSPIDGHSYASIEWVKEQPFASKREIDSFLPFLESHKYDNITIVNSFDGL